jgi:hypothetical protein
MIVVVNQLDGCPDHGALGVDGLPTLGILRHLDPLDIGCIAIYRNGTRAIKIDAPQVRHPGGPQGRMEVLYARTQEIRQGDRG